MTDDRLSAREPGGHDDSHLLVVSPAAPGDIEVDAAEHQLVGTVLEPDARAPARPPNHAGGPRGTPTGDAGPPAAGATSADHYNVPVAEVRPASSNMTPAAGRPSRPIR